jgi:transcriptional regulator with XRE-family HTH domain
VNLSTKSPRAIDRHVGDGVRMRRKTQGMTQKKLGDALGLTFQWIQKYEKGTNRIGVSRLQHIASIQQVQSPSSSKAHPDRCIHWIKRSRPAPSLIFSPRRTGCADEGLHARQKRETRAIHCWLGYADRRRQTLTSRGADHFVRIIELASLME